MAELDPDVREPIVIPPGAGEIIGDSADRRVEVLSERDELHATWSRFGPGREGAGLHIHYNHTDLFYVLEGELTVRLGIEDEQVTMPVGSLARIPPLVVHGFRNAGDTDVKYLNLHAPGEGFIDYMRGLRDGTGVEFDQHEPPPDGGRPKQEAVVSTGEVAVDEPGGRVTELADVEAIAVSETRLEGAGDIAPVGDDQKLRSYFVLEGELELTIGGRPVAAPAGTWAQAPAGVPVSIAAPAPARLLTIVTPSATA